MRHFRKATATFIRIIIYFAVGFSKNLLGLMNTK